jgi:hypothetical protein
MLEANLEQKEFEQILEVLAELNEERAEERCHDFFGVFEAGGAERGETKRHFAKASASLCGTRHYDTFAVILRGLGFDDNRILEFIKERTYIACCR